MLINYDLTGAAVTRNLLTLCLAQVLILNSSMSEELGGRQGRRRRDIAAFCAPIRVPTLG